MVQILRYRRKARRALAESDAGAYAALRRSGSAPVAARAEAVRHAPERRDARVRGRYTAHRDRFVIVRRMSLTAHLLELQGLTC